MLKTVILLLALTTTVLFGYNVMAADAAKGEAIAKGCKCHKGELDGRPAAEIVKALNDFKSGARNNKLMKRKADGLSDEDMENVAAYFESLK